MFDPFHVYSRSQKKTHTGQIIRKKPVSQSGSVSVKDLPLIRSYASALGYDLVLKNSITPIPPPVKIRSFLTSDISILYEFRHNGQVSVPLSDIAQLFHNKPIFNFNPGYQYKCLEFDVTFYLTFITASQRTSDSHLLRIASGHVYIETAIPSFCTLHIEYGTGNSVQGVLLSSNTQYVGYNLTQSIPYSGVLDVQKYQKYGAEADQEFHKWKDNPSSLSSSSVATISFLQTNNNTTDYSKAASFAVYAYAVFEEL